MASSDRLIGFSTGALAKGDFRAGLRLLRERGISAVELSALREEELLPLMQSLDQLDLTGFDYVSVHAPTRLKQLDERLAIQWLLGAVRHGMPIIVHPDVMMKPEIWYEYLGNQLVIENMDKRKPNGRTSEELANLFRPFPEAVFCFDVAHAAQIDPTMTEAAQMLRLFGPRLRQIHASGVSTASGHGRLSSAASFSISRVSHLVPEEAPIILESPVDESAIMSEIDFARQAFNPWLDRLRAEIDDMFASGIRELRHNQAASFLRRLQITGAKLSDFEVVISNLPFGGAYRPGDVMLSARELLNRLSDKEKSQLKEYLLQRLRDLTFQFPDLKREFSEQFAGIESHQSA